VTEAEKTDESVLSNINFTLKPKDLLVVIGEVGSGKSSLIHSVLGETSKKSGKQRVQGTIAYVE
jgi:ATP-binding cassette subfamily C (CFTR/MRP) protein 4